MTGAALLQKMWNSQPLIPRKLEVVIIREKTATQAERIVASNYFRKINSEGEINAESTACA
jgi:hypothetical protein